MQTLHLKVSDKIYDNLLWLLSKFSKEEIEIIDDDDFATTQKYLQNELKEIDAGEAKFYSQEQLDKRLDKYEDNL